MLFPVRPLLNPFPQKIDLASCQLPIGVLRGHSLIEILRRDPVNDLTFLRPIVSLLERGLADPGTREYWCAKLRQLGPEFDTRVRSRRERKGEPPLNADAMIKASIIRLLAWMDRN